MHRLDKLTSGLMLLARNAVAHRELDIQFEKSEVSKLYHAVLEGHPDGSEQQIKLRLRKDGVRLALHAKEISLKHPITSEAPHFELPDPEDFEPLLGNHQDEIPGGPSSGL